MRVFRKTKFNPMVEFSLAIDANRFFAEVKK